MKIINSLNFITLSIFMMALAVMPQVHAEENYHFDKVWPKIEQPWYFNAPQGIAVGSDGLVYVADTNFNRVQVFNENGQFIRSFGTGAKEKEVAKDGEFWDPSGIAVSINGFVYVSDKTRIQVFDNNGNFIRSWRSPNAPGVSSFYSRAIAIDTSESVYIIENRKHSIMVFTTEGKFIRSWQIEGFSDDEIGGLSGIANSSNNRIYVADRLNHKIHVFDTNGELINSWENEKTEDEALQTPTGITISTNGLIYVTNQDDSKIQVFNSDGVFIRSWKTNIMSLSEHGIAISSSGLIYLTDSSNNQIHIFNHEGEFIRNWKSRGTVYGEFNNPKGVAISTNDLLYVVDSENNRIQVFNNDGKFIRQWGNKGTENGQFDTPKGIAISTDNLVYVVDRGNHRVQVFNSDGAFVFTWGNEGSKNGEFMLPNDIEVSANNKIYVSDDYNHRIQVFNTAGKFIHHLGSDGQFHHPQDMAVSVGGLVYVSDASFYRIQVFNIEGTFIRSWQSNDDIDMLEFYNSISLSPNGLLYVTDWRRSQVQVFNTMGKFVKTIAPKGSDFGHVLRPSDLVFNSNDELFVSDGGNNRIQKFIFSKTIAHSYKAILLAGGGPPTEAYNNLIWNETQALTVQAHQALRSQGFQKNEVKYLTAGNILSDLDGNGQIDDLEAASLASLQQAITEWAIDATDVVIYLADHGGPGLFQVNQSEVLNETQLSQWVHQLDEKIPGKVTVIIESCKSGSFLNSLAGQQRFLIASADANQPAVISNGGLNAFSYFFWQQIGSGADLETAFKRSRQGMSRQIIAGRTQNAQLDSNGDQQFNSTDDYTTLAGFCLGKCTKYAANPPKIDKVTESRTLNANVKVELSMEVTSLEAITNAWVVFTRPDFKHTDANEPVSELPKIPLKCTKTEPKRTCSTSYNQFDLIGDYQFTYFAKDNEGQMAIPEVTTITQVQGISVNTPPTDTNPPITNINQYSGSWYDPSHNGEGYAIEMLANGLAQITCYTYDKNGQQVWIVGVGGIVDQTIAVSDAIITQGAKFGSEFNSADVVRKRWGTLIFTFTDCNHAQVKYSGPEDYGSGTLNLERLSSIAGLSCDQTDNPEDSTIGLGKITGTWFDPGHNGEGYVIEVLDNNRATVYWYTYDQNGQQTWITGTGTVQGRRIIMDQTIFTEGGIFGADFNPDSVQRKKWGNISFEFSSCDKGVVNYESTAGFGSGQLDLERLTTIDGYACETLP